LKVKLGPEKKRLQSEIERKMTAYHEAGHAIVAHFLPHTDPVHRISIVSRGRALGFTMTPPEQDKYQQTKAELEEQISVMLGGRAAEKLIFNQLTGGVSSDLERVTRIARAMVMDYGMSDLAPINYGPIYDYTDYGRALMEPYTPSEEIKKKVDSAVDAIVDEGWERTVKLLKSHKKELDAVADRLLEIESMDQDEFEKVVGVPKVKAQE
jgi:cell division protease FtsH